MNHNYYRFTNISNHLKKNNNVTIYLTNYYIKINQLSEHIPAQFFFSKKKTKEINRIHLDFLSPYNLPINIHPFSPGEREREFIWSAGTQASFGISATGSRQSFSSRRKKGGPWNTLEETRTLRAADFPIGPPQIVNNASPSSREISALRSHYHVNIVVRHPTSSIHYSTVT